MSYPFYASVSRHFIDMRWCDVRIPDSSSTDKTNTRADSKVLLLAHEDNFSASKVRSNHRIKVIDINYQCCHVYM